MEHRFGTRYPAGVEAAVVHARLGATRGRIRDVSRSGIFVELPDLRGGDASAARLWFTPVRLKFRLPDDPSRTPHYWRGYVTRIADDGVAATTTAPGAAERDDLTALIEHARRRAPESLELSA